MSNAIKSFDEETRFTFRPITMLVPLLVALMSLALSAYASYNTSDKATGVRISIVETKQETQAVEVLRRLDRLENKLDAVISADILRNNSPRR